MKTSDYPVNPLPVDEYVAQEWWGTVTYAEVLRQLASEQPSGLAFIDDDQRLTWAEYDALSDQLAVALSGLRLERGDRIGVLMPDGATVHIVYMAAEKAGLVVMGIGSKAGPREIDHLMRASNASALVVPRDYRREDLGSLTSAWRDNLSEFQYLIELHSQGEIMINGSRYTDTSERDPTEVVKAGAIGPNDLFLLNSTSGTTGLPKCVMHTQNRWIYFHRLAVEAAALTSDDVFMSVVPAPFGFGLWTAHVTPLLLGATTVLTSRFKPSKVLQLIERERVSVLCSVSTQFIMMLNDPGLAAHDLHSLRVLFTGGEAVPEERAKAFEQQTGAKVLQFYGSNETGALSRTTLSDSSEDRLRTAGQVIEEMSVRLFDEDGTDITATGGPGQAACRGPATCLGYFNDEPANERLFSEEGWMLTGDIATIDQRRYLRVVGRRSDIIIRGGKNISAAAVESGVLTHPDIAMVAAVAKPDSIFGERVCVYVVPANGSDVTLDSIVEHLHARGVTREWWPEGLVVVPDLPRASGGKVAKGELRKDLARRDAESHGRTEVGRPSETS